MEALRWCDVHDALQFAMTALQRRVASARVMDLVESIRLIVSAVLALAVPPNDPLLSLARTEQTGRCTTQIAEGTASLAVLDLELQLRSVMRGCLGGAVHSRSRDPYVTAAYRYVLRERHRIPSRKPLKNAHKLVACVRGSCTGTTTTKPTTTEPPRNCEKCCPLTKWVNAMFVLFREPPSRCQMAVYPII